MDMARASALVMNHKRAILDSLRDQGEHVAVVVMEALHEWTTDPWKVLGDRLGMKFADEPAAGKEPDDAQPPQTDLGDLSDRQVDFDVDMIRLMGEYGVRAAVLAFSWVDEGDSTTVSAAVYVPDGVPASEKCKDDLTGDVAKRWTRFWKEHCITGQ